MANQIIGNPTRALDLNGYVVPGAKMNVYQSGTATLLSVYSDFDGTILAANPVIADADGIFPQRYVTAAAKVVITTADDVTLYTLDPVPVVPSTGAAASLISFDPSVNAPYTNVQDAIDGIADAVAILEGSTSIGYVTPRDFDATAGSGGDDTAAVQAAMASNVPMFIDRPYRISAAVTHGNLVGKRVFGNGPVTSLITMTNATQNGLVKTGAGGLIVENIGITTSVDKTAGAAITTTDTAQDRIVNCHIYGASASVRLWNGIVIDGLIPTIEANYILSCRSTGITLGNTNSGFGSEATVSGNVLNTADVSNTAIGLLYNTGLRTVKVSNNTLQTYAYGIQCAPTTGYTPQSIIVTANVFELNSVGSFVASLPTSSTTVYDAILITGNQFNQTSGKSIILSGASQFINLISICANTFNFTSSTQVELGNGSLATVDGNTFRGSSSAFVPLVLTATYPSATFIGNNNTLSLTTFYALNGNTGAFRAANIVAA